MVYRDRVASSFREIPVDSIEANPYQPRADASGDELVDSVRQHGLLQPILVTPGPRGFRIIAGERRWRAAMAAGLKKVPAVVVRAGSEEQAVLALVENLQRRPLSYWEEAMAYRRLLEEFGLTQQELGELVGRSQSAIANKLRLLHLEEPVRRELQEGGLSERHARALLMLDDPEARLEVARRARREQLSVRETEELVRRWKTRGHARVRRSRRIAVIKDIRIFLNAFRKAVSALREAGVEVQMEERREEGYLEVVVRVALGSATRESRNAEGGGRSTH